MSGRAAQFDKHVIYPDSRMKQAQSETTVYRPVSSWWVGESGKVRGRRRADGPVGAGIRQPERASRWSVARVVLTLATALWFVVTLPFRLVFWVIAWLGRLTAVVLGFMLMVVGMALWAGPLFFVGIPLFLVGLVLTLRCLD